jgi:DnaJ family protein C protein 17
LFSKFGKVESTLLLKDRKMRIGDEPKKRVIATGVVVFKSIVGAHAAVEDLKRQSGLEWNVFKSIEWAEGKEPDCLQVHNGSTSSTTTSESATDVPVNPVEKLRESFKSFESSRPSQSTPTVSNGDNRAAQKNGDETRKAPSFTSFSSAKLNSSGSATSAKRKESPSFEEITMIRLKNAERKRLEEQIRKEEAQAEE